MNRQDCLQIGTIVKTHGIHGEVILEIKNPELIENIKESVLLELEGLLVPFFIDCFHPVSNQRIRVKFDWTNSDKQAKKLCSSPVYIPAGMHQINKTSVHETPELVEDFIVIDVRAGELGKVTQVIDNNNNLLMEITGNRNNPLLIPLHPDLIHEINSAEKTITIETPDGLLEIYD